MSIISGFLLINKPPHITSFACITHIKKIIKEKIKIGHTGTLDPFATGLLIIAIGRQATRNIHCFSSLKKEYIAQAKLGELRDTLDYTGTILDTKQITGITEKNLKQAIAALGNSYQQIPPVYSALKYEGIPLYKLARHQQCTEEQLRNIASLKSKIIHLHSITLLNFSSPYFTIKAQVPSGTYIRSLMHTIANKIDNCATTYELTRTRIGLFNLEQAIHIENIKQLSDLQQHVIQIEQCMQKIEESNSSC
jgi:tRNA pseudouridine55 synthase